jgi:predicted MFS family arabinose efflux permease
MTHQPPLQRSSAGLSRPMTLLLAAAAGVSVGNLYWAQPLLAPVADSFDVAPGSAGLVLTLTQTGYAAGVFLIVPLGDSLNRRLMIPIVMLLASGALAATALAPSFPILLGVAALAGVASVTGPILSPLAGDLSTDEQRGRVLGTVASGMMLGILTARAASGLIADLLGWRMVFAAAAVLTLAMATAMVSRLPPMPARQGLPYGKLLISVTCTLRNPHVRATILTGALPMSVFTLFWTGITLLLSAEPFSYSAGQIGLVGILGAAGAASAQGTGRLYDRGLSDQVIGGGIALALASLFIGQIGQRSLPAILAAIAIFSAGVQAVLVLAQTRMMAINPAARSRLNTAYVVGNFIAGAAGSAAAGLIWEWRGWDGLMVAGGAILLVSLALWQRQRARPLAA